MKRRNFLQLLTSGTASAFVVGRSSNNDVVPASDYQELEQHTITDVQFTDVELHYPRQVGKNSRLDIHGMGPTVHVTLLTTDKGAQGWGMTRGPKRAEEMADYLKGKRITEVFDPAVGFTDQKVRPFDVPLHDLAGIILDKPVYEMMGRKEPMTTNCYSGMIYFDDLEPEDNPAGVDKILEECQWDYDYGYRQFKLKIGRGNKWMDPDEGMQRDIEVTKLVDEHFPDCDILVDANNGYTLEDTIAYMEGIGDIDLFWFEEPFHENYDDYLELRKWLLDNGVQVFLADAEFKPDQELMRRLYKTRIVDIHLTDTIGRGFTPWRQLLPELCEMGTSASPHAWGSLFKTHYNAHLMGAYGNMPTIEGVTCTSDHVDFGDYKLEDGKIIPSSAPGFGMELLKTP